MDLLDTSTPVRPGEELDAARLSQYLYDRIPALQGDLIVEQFPSGFSNLTYLLKIGDRELVLRRPPIGAKIKTAHDMGREYRIVAHLYPHFTKVPRPIFFCDDDSILGVPFYVMERVKGIILRARAPKALDLSPPVMRNLSKSFVENLAEIHRLDYQEAGLGDLGQPRGYVTRQIEGWTRRYFAARTDNVPQVERLAAWLHENIREESEYSALIHNDYKYDNLVLATDDLSRVVAVLDWEMATIGDALMDLGTTLGYWVESQDTDEWQQFGFGLTNLPGNLSRRELVEYYAKCTGGDVSDAVFYYAFGLLKIAVIVQQIYSRYRSGLTSDSRFSNLGKVVTACGIQAQLAIEKRRIDSLG